MNLEEAKAKYRDHEKTKLITQSLEDLGNTIYLKGLVGSSISLVATAVSSLLQKHHVFILQDKEEAAYFLNDLENINKDQQNFYFFPSSYKVPYEVEMVDNGNVVLRAEVLNHLTTRAGKMMIVTYPEAMSEKVVTKKNLASNTFLIKINEKYSIEFIDEFLQENNFRHVEYVYEPGQFSIRGGIVDVFSFSNEYPFRIEFFGDEVNSIRYFDPSNQLSVQKLVHASIIPNIQDRMLRESRETFLDFIPQDSCIWIKSYNVTIECLKKEFDKAVFHYHKLQSILEHLKPEELYTQAEEFKKLAKKFSLIEFGAQPSFKHHVEVQYEMLPQPSFNKNFELLTQNLQGNSKHGYENILFGSNAKQLERLHKIFEDLGKEVKFYPENVAITEGFIDKNLQIAFYTDHQIFERYHRFFLREGFKKNKEALTLKELQNLEPGDFVTHIDHGVGRFSGLEKINVNGKEQEAVRLVYRDNDILYVSIHSLHRISKYSGKEGTPPSINKLGSQAWSNLKAKTKKRVKEIAYDLIKLYAKRKALDGFRFSPDNYMQTELESSFMYEDTPDQLKATVAVKKDMENDSPMDRLICGDVGFGKTEIAIRAAFKAVCDSKQVAVLVPTTILSTQHFKNFKERLKDFPCTVDYINRFKPAAKQKETIRKLASGEVDIIIGTHKLVNSAIKFKNLGLMIIDEEQKFGVGVKDKLKTLRENIDTLTLTATPIPRTLQFSMMGARDLSIINTAPPNRYPVQTELRTFNEETIRDAVMYEVSRGGQVFFVHNKVQNITEVSGMIQRLCPSVKIAIGHGQMDGEKLEQVMTDFIDGFYDVLVATTIIESGIDISNANTIIINEAQNFGLSDLHQLRGRVGRSNKKAFCILLAPPFEFLTAEARRRLTALEQFSDLGSGMNIAMRDLDIRGAGNLLGAEQSGFISEIGFDMYHKILDEAVQELKETEFKDVYDTDGNNYKKDFVKDCQIETDLEILIPDHYISNISERLNVYRDLDNIETEFDLEVFKNNLIDRFGPMPLQTIQLIDTIKLRWLAKEIGFEKLILKGEKLIAYFVSDNQSLYYQSEKFTGVLNFIKSNPLGYKMYEKKNMLALSCMGVKSIKQAIQKLSPILESNLVLNK